MIRAILFVAVVVSLLWIGFSGIVSDGVPVQANKADQQQAVKKGISEERLKRLIERLEPRDPTKLYGRQLAIASGSTDLPAWKVWCYREKWEKQGKQLPEWVNGPKEFPGRTIVLREGEKPPMSCEEIRSWVENGVTYKEYNCGECDCCEQPVLLCSELTDVSLGDLKGLPSELHVTVSGEPFIEQISVGPIPAILVVDPGPNVHVIYNASGIPIEVDCGGSATAGISVDIVCEDGNFFALVDCSILVPSGEVSFVGQHIPMGSALSLPIEQTAGPSFYYVIWNDPNGCLTFGGSGSCSPCEDGELTISE